MTYDDISYKFRRSSASTQFSAETHEFKCEFY